jgi:hypothetical protein
MVAMRRCHLNNLRVSGARNMKLCMKTEHFTNYVRNTVFKSKLQTWRRHESFKLYLT